MTWKIVHKVVVVYIFLLLPSIWSPSFISALSLARKIRSNNKTNKIYYAPPPNFPFGPFFSSMQDEWKWNPNQNKPENPSKRRKKPMKWKKREMFNKILFIIIYFNITIPMIFIFMEDLRFWIFYTFFVVDSLNTANDEREKSRLVILIIRLSALLCAS